MKNEETTTLRLVALKLHWKIIVAARGRTGRHFANWIEFEEIS
jgi:hypothetical protein